MCTVQFFEEPDLLFERSFFPKKIIKPLPKHFGVGWIFPVDVGGEFEVRVWCEISNSNATIFIRGVDAVDPNDGESIGVNIRIYVLIVGPGICESLEIF